MLQVLFKKIQNEKLSYINKFSLILDGVLVHVNVDTVLKSLSHILFSTLLIYENILPSLC